MKWEKGALYEVVWKDIIAYSGWEEEGTSQPPATCRSHGYLTDYRRGKSGYIRLSGTVGFEGQASPEYTQHIVIPLPVIVSAQKKTPGD